MLILEDRLFIGQGLHKAAYIYPGQPDKVVKVPFDPRDGELRHELAYRRSRRLRKLDSELLARYYGTAETDRGRGYVFERVINADGLEIARGKVNYGSADLGKLIGKKTGEFAQVLDKSATDLPDTIIHRDNLVMMN